MPVRLPSTTWRKRSSDMSTTGTDSVDQTPAFATHTSSRPSASTAAGTSASAAASSVRSACSGSRRSRPPAARPRRRSTGSGSPRGTLGREGPYRCRTDAARAAGDEDALARQSQIHGVEHMLRAVRYAPPHAGPRGPRSRDLTTNEDRPAWPSRNARPQSPGAIVAVITTASVQLPSRPASAASRRSSPTGSARPAVRTATGRTRPRLPESSGCASSRSRSMPWAATARRRRSAWARSTPSFPASSRSSSSVTRR